MQVEVIRAENEHALKAQEARLLASVKQVEEDAAQAQIRAAALAQVSIGACLQTQNQDAEDAKSKSLIKAVRQAERLKVLSGHVRPVDTATSGLGHPLCCVDTLRSSLQHCLRAQSDLVKQSFEYCFSWSASACSNKGSSSWGMRRRSCRTRQPKLYIMQLRRTGVAHGRLLH